jgi:hypothetical protein
VSEVEPLYLAELAAYELGVGATTLRYANGRGLVTTPSETPANTEYNPRIRQPVNVARHCFAPRATSGRSVFAPGELVLKNGDGVLDDVLTDFALDGRTLTIRRGLPGAAYPGGFTTVFTGTMEQAEAKDDSVIVRVKDRAFALDVPLQATLYAGDNADGEGLEGTADDLKGKPKPLCFGVARNVAPPCVNTGKLIYQVNDGELDSVDAVYDAGISLGWTPASFVELDHGEGDTIGYRALATPTALIIAGLDDGTVTPKVLRTEDGVTFTDVTDAAMTGSGNRPAGIATDGSRIVLLLKTKIFTSDDDGETWTERTVPGDWAAVEASGLVYDAVNDYFIATGTGSSAKAVIRSADGATWAAVTTTAVNDLLGVAVHLGTAIFARGTATLSVSTDGGGTFSSQTTGISAGITSVGRMGGRWWAGETTGAGRVVRYSDTLVTWTQPILPVTANTVPNYTAFHEYEGILFVAGTHPMYSLDGGLSFAASEISHGFSPSAFGAFFNDRWYLAVSTAAMSGLFVSVSGETYGSLADLEDDTLAPAPGTWKYISHADGSYVRLGSSPYGTVTADVTQGVTGADRTAGSLFENVLTKAGYTSADWVTGDVTALDAADNSELGLWSYDDGLTVAEAIDRIANTVGAWWGPRASDGDFRIVQLTLPSGTPDATLFANDMVRGSFRLIPTSDEGRGLPAWRTTLRYQRNWTPQTDGIAFGVSDARRAFLAAEWRETSDSDATVKTSYLLARDLVEETLYDAEADALAEAQRRQVIRETKRRMFEVTVKETDTTASLDLGQVVTVTHSRYGLSAGADFRIIGVEPNAKDREISLILWGT